MFIDTHAHYDDAAFSEDRDELLAALPSKGTDKVVIPSCDVAGSSAVLKLAEQYPHVYAACGIHPENLSDEPLNEVEKLRPFVSHPKCVAVGEIGLDYYWDKSRKEEQKAVFKAQLALALEYELPVIVHDREAHGDAFKIVSSHPDLKGVFHCFSGSAEMAEELLKRGWYLGFDGPITYKNARKTVEVLEICPLDRILLETDSPYLSPVPMRGKRNDSSNLVYIAEKIAGIKGVPLKRLAEQTSENAAMLFGLR